MLWYTDLECHVAKLSSSRAKLVPGNEVYGLDRSAAPRSCHGPVEATECQGVGFMQGWLYIVI